MVDILKKKYDFKAYLKMSFSPVRKWTQENLTLEVLAGAAMLVIMLPYVSVSSQHLLTVVCQLHLSKTGGGGRKCKLTKLIN